MGLTKLDKKKKIKFRISIRMRRVQIYTFKFYAYLTWEYFQPNEINR